MRKRLGVLAIVVLFSFIAAALFLSHVFPQKTETPQTKKLLGIDTNPVPVTVLPNEQKPDSETPENKAAKVLEYVLKEFGGRNDLNLKDYRYVAVANLNFETQKNAVYYLYWFSNDKMAFQREDTLTHLTSTVPNTLIKQRVVPEITGLYTALNFQHEMGLNITTLEVKTDVLSWVVTFDLKEKTKAERIF